ncbi:low temperature-induced protein [Romeria aff. gracilis LEGE 07310]|uniref:Low temperature-induced protein n=1 Tax=Vasconcelosia minhoensis LEGE 07310 TaxID=915328 RepID=A0A8J7AMT2_9CYAN|nr:low temperature-induced protein [Romeria gracilis]MBE9077364.1 low temperature-induced protein [Romeria aff. gracilis LEGE 07310]
MTPLNLSISNLWKNLRVLAIAFTFVLLFFVSAAPALAIGSAPSHPASGEEPLEGVFKESQESVKGGPRKMGEVQKKANEGLNEVQGKANVESMNRPENSSAEAVSEQVQEALESVTGKR